MPGSFRPRQAQAQRMRSIYIDTYKCLFRTFQEASTSFQ
jgi:hypothetical protein